MLECFQVKSTGFKPNGKMSNTYNRCLNFIFSLVLFFYIHYKQNFWLISYSLRRAYDAPLIVQIACYISSWTGSLDQERNPDPLYKVLITKLIYYMFLYILIFILLYYYLFILLFINKVVLYINKKCRLHKTRINNYFF